jgi:hypothetical protein
MCVVHKYRKYVLTSDIYVRSILLVTTALQHTTLSLCTPLTAKSSQSIKIAVVIIEKIAGITIDCQSCFSLLEKKTVFVANSKCKTFQILALNVCSYFVSL